MFALPGGAARPHGQTRVSFRQLFLLASVLPYLLLGLWAGQPHSHASHGAADEAHVHCQAADFDAPFVSASDAPFAHDDCALCLWAAQSAGVSSDVPWLQTATRADFVTFASFDSTFYSLFPGAVPGRGPPTL